MRDPHPRSDRHAAGLGSVRIHVDAANDFVGLRVEDGVRETRSCIEVRAVRFEVGEVLVQGHRLRPPSPCEAGSCVDVVDARRPGLVVALIVLGPERLEDEQRGLEPDGNFEVVGNQRGRDEPV
jgi:hypothetical protein